MGNYIKNNNIILKLICDDRIISRLKQELNDYYDFIIGDIQQYFTIYLYADDVKYKKISNQFNHKIKFIKDRDGLVLLNKENKEIVAFYNDINDNVIQFIEEIIISLFGMFLTNQNYFFLHAACVEKAGKSIAIIGDRSSGKTTLLNILLQNGYNFVCNSHLGIRDEEDIIKVIGSPSRMGMRVETLEKTTKTDVKEKIFSFTEFRKRFGMDAERNLRKIRSKKFNIKLNEIKNIYNVDLINSSILSLIIIPEYVEQLEHIKLRKIEESSKKREIILKNKVDGVYNTTKYINSLDMGRKTNLPNNLNKVNIYKVYQSEKCIDELIAFTQSN